MFNFQGDLKQFLIATRKSSVGIVGNKERPAPLTLKQIVTIVKQIASALECITSKNYVHRDIAARNCLITSSLSVKITFASLSKTNYATEYFLRRDRVRRENTFYFQIFNISTNLLEDEAWLKLFLCSIVITFEMASSRGGRRQSVYRCYWRIFVRRPCVGNIHESRITFLKIVEQRVSSFAAETSSAMEITQIYALANGPATACLLVVISGRKTVFYTNQRRVEKSSQRIVFG